MKSLNKALLGASIAVLALGLNGCFSLRPEVAGMDQVGPDEVVVVGRVRTDPPVSAADQNIQWGIGTGMLKNAFLCVGDGDWTYPRPDGSSAGALNHAIKTPWDQWFFARMPKRDFNVQGLMLYTSLRTQITMMNTDGSSAGTTDVRRADFPAHLRVRVLPTDRVIFIGTLVFRRDEFDHPLGVRVYDDYRRARAVLRDRLGDVPMRVSLPVPEDRLE